MCLSGSAIKIRARSLPLFSISLALKVEKARGPGDMDGKKVGMISPGEMHDGLPTHICGFNLLSNQKGGSEWQWQGEKLASSSCCC
jgi:hypothetical protein